MLKVIARSFGNPRSAPRVLGTQPRRDLVEHRPPEDRALAPNAFFGDVEHPVEAHPAGTAVVVPAAGADADPIPVVGWVLPTAQHQTQECCDRGRRRVPDGRYLFKSGDTLPTEVELAKQFGVSRPTLREAFRILESESLIVVRPGSRGGVEVSTPDISVAAKDFGLLLQLSATTLADLYEARKVIEPVAARMLAVPHTQRDIDDLNASVGLLAVLVNGGVEDADFGEWASAVYRFHDLIMERCDNNTLAIFSGMLREVISRHLSRAVSARSKPSSARRLGRL
jgi:DNA-binding FadR family transcriptional regulator